MKQEQHFIDYIEQSIIRNWNLNALTDYKGATLQYKDVARKIAKFHIVLESAGIQPGDKIAVCGRNSAHWAVTFLASITYRAVIVPILHEFKADNIHNIVNHSEARLLFVGDQVWENLNEDAMPQLLGVILMTEFTPVVCRDKRLMEAFEHRNTLYGQRYPKNFRPEHICYRKDEPEELAIINYTSGTTGYSKGVMLPYRSLWSNVNYCHEMLPVKPGDNIVSMLPMGHVFGMTYDFLYGFSAGAHIYFLTRMPTPKIIAQSFAEIKPRVISCVPLIVEKIIKKNILPRVDNKIGKLLLHVPIINDKIRALARKEAMEIFGGNFDEIIIGGAPFNAEVEHFLKQISFPYTIAYGMTECGPIICSSRWETMKLASCGKAATRMGRIGDEAFIPVLIDVYVKDRNAARIVFNISEAIRCFDKQQVEKAIETYFADKNFYHAREEKQELLDKLIERDGLSPGESSTREILDSHGKLRWRQSRISFLKNRPYHQHVTEYLTLLGDEQVPEILRVRMAEALAWFNLSVRRHEIADAGRKLLARGNCSPELAKEVQRMINRVESKK